MTQVRKFRFYLPFALVSAMLLITWIIFLTKSLIPQLQHYIGLILFTPILYYTLIDKTLKKPLILLGAYLIIGTVNILSFLPFILTSGLRFTFDEYELYICLNGIAALVLTVYGILNFDTLANIYFDYKESKGML
jgi:hypothetical protein